jgi:hypothetical protein
MYVGANNSDHTASCDQFINEVEFCSSLIIARI